MVSKSALAKASAALPGMVLGPGLTIVLLMTLPIALVDDAFISFRYVFHLIHDGQLVFNLGQRIEGATNLLWMLVLAAGAVTTGLRIDVLALGLSLALFAYTVGRTTGLARQVTGSGPTSILVTAAVFVNADVFLTATNGLEASLYMAILVECLGCLMAGHGLVLGTLLGLLFMTRPEGFGVGLVMAAAHIVLRPSRQNGFRVAGPWLAIVAATTLFRLVYFHAPVPNSVVAKSFPPTMLPGVLVHDAWPYVQGFVLHDVVLAVMGCAMALASLHALVRGRPASSDTRPIVVLLVASTCVIAMSFVVAARNGGDWMDHWRLLTQYAPAYAMGGAAVAAAYPYRTVVAAACLAGSLWSVPAPTCCRPVISMMPPGSFFSDAAARLEKVVRPDDVVSAEAAGVLPYRMMKTQIHDPTGLLDVHIARYGTPAIPYGKTDPAYTFGEVRPSFMVWHWAGHVARAPAALRANYTGFCARFCSDRQNAMVVLVRTDRIDDAVRDVFSDWQPWTVD